MEFDDAPRDRIRDCAKIGERYFGYRAGGKPAKTFQYSGDSTRTRRPLAHALTDYLEYKENGKDSTAKVIDSMVSLEIENGMGKFLTVQRSIAGDRNKHLMTGYEGRAITKKEALGTARDYYVREDGAATNELGFHRRLKDFIGWDLPMAPRFNEPDCALYLETIFPLLYVEQKLGWGRLPARYPTWLGIRDVGRRTVEFILGLEAYATAIERAAVNEEIKRLRREWASARSRAERSGSAVAGIVRGIPVEPIASWPPEVAPTPAGGVQASIATLTQFGIGVVRMRACLPTRSTTHQRPSRSWMCANVSAATSDRRSP